MAVVVAFGRWKGLGALLGLGFTLAVIVFFLVPNVLQGRNPVLVSVVAAALMMIVTLYLAHGPGLKTVVALFGTLGALIITALLAWIFVVLTDLTGFSTEEANLIRIESGILSLQGLILGGIIIGSLGVLDDVTMTQASAVQELKDANFDLGVWDLFSRGSKVGRDHVASTVNTLVLAYVGASLPLFILFNITGSSFSSIVNGEVVVMEIIRSFVGSIGLVAAVPFTTALAAWAACQARGAGPEAGVGSAGTRSVTWRADRVRLGR